MALKFDTLFTNCILCDAMPVHTQKLIKTFFNPNFHSILTKSLIERVAQM